MPEFLTKRFLLAVLRGLIEAFGGRLDLRDEARLEATLAAPQATFRGAEPYPTPAAKAAAYLVGIAKGHPFVDGNKRTALAAMDVFLCLSGWKPTPGDGPTFGPVVKVARCAHGVEGPPDHRCRAYLAPV